jgi:hypothetical protein
MRESANDLKQESFDLPFLLDEIDVLAEELTKLAPSIDRTVIELRLAQMRQIVEQVHKRQGEAACGFVCRNC